MVTCARCGAESPEGMNVCRACGGALDSRARHCVSCGRAIDWNANVCPYCGHDFRLTQAGSRKEPMSTGIKILLYLVSFFIWIAGIVIGIIYMTRTDPEEKRVGKICLVLGIVSIVVSIGLAFTLYALVLGFGSPGDGINSTPTTFLSRTIDGDEMRFTFGPVSSEVRWSDVTFLLEDGTGAAIWQPSTTDLTGAGLVTEAYPAEYMSGMTVTFSATDASGNGLINGNDYFTLAASPAFDVSAVYQVTVIYEPTSGLMASSTFSG